MKSERRLSFSEIWRWPSLLAGLTMFGLVSALLGQGGVWWVLSWVALATPLVVTAGFMIGSRRRPLAR